MSREQKAPEFHVPMGRISVRRSGILTATLNGSNVGLAFYWPERQIGALVHCLLPEAPTAQNPLDTKYVNQAIPVVMQLLGISKEDAGQVRVWIAGGADLRVQFTKQNPQHVGLQNAALARAQLQAQGFMIENDVSGTEPDQKLKIDCDTGTISVG